MHSQNLILFTILFACVSSAWGLKCWQCNSKDNTNCNDPFNPNADGSLLKECVLPPTANATTDKPYCRKTTQKTALRGMKEEEKRVIRTCGFIADHRLKLDEGEEANALQCYRRAGTFETESLYCACYAEGCNPAGRPMPGFATFAGLLAICGVFTQIFTKVSN